MAPAAEGRGLGGGGASAGLGALCCARSAARGCGRRAEMLLCPVIRKLQHKRVVLASSSPRRQEILSNAVSGPGPGSGGAGVWRGRGLWGPGLQTRA